jgi:hypothetical protein
MTSVNPRVIGVVVCVAAGNVLDKTLDDLTTSHGHTMQPYF